MTAVRFIHIGDIHIIDSRRDEYSKIFEMLYDSIRAQIAEVKIPCIIVVPGDIYDTKTRVSANNINDVKNFLYNLQLLAHTVIIPGNHDLQVSKPGGPDLLTPTISNSSNLENLTYYRHSGIYKIPQFDFINFVVSAPDDAIYQRNNPVVFNSTNTEGEIVRQPGQLYISLMHEEIAGASAFGYSFSGRRFDGTSVTKEDFVNCDLTMLNHIHQQQLLTERAGYAGSLIQKNFGEYHNGHGFLVWDVDLPVDGKLANIQCYSVDIANPHGYLTIKYKQNIDITEGPLPIAPIAVRIEYTKCTEKFIIDQCEIVKAKYGHIKNIRCTDDLNAVSAPTPTESSESTATPAESTQTESPDPITPTPVTKPIGPPIQNADKESILRASEEIASVETQVILIRQLLEDNPLTEALIDMHRFKATELLDTSPGNAVARGSRWRLINMKFSNMFCYGPDNEVSFETLFNSVSGIIAKNKSGKSAFIDILMFTLYDELPRGNRTNILNHTYRDGGGAPASNYRVMVELEIDGKRASIIKSLVSKGHPKLNFTLDGNDLTQGTTNETQKLIATYLGNYVDAINTSIVLQKGPDDFVHMKAESRKVVLARLFNLNIFGDLLKFAKEEQLRLKAIISEKTNVIKIFTGNSSDDSLNNLIARKEQLDNTIPSRRENITELVEELNKLCDIWRDKNPVNVTELVDPVTSQELIELIGLENIETEYVPLIYTVIDRPIKPRPEVQPYSGNVNMTLNKLKAFTDLQVSTIIPKISNQPTQIVPNIANQPTQIIPRKIIVDYLQKLNITADPDTLYYKDIGAKDMPYNLDKHKDLVAKQLPDINYLEIIKCLMQSETHLQLPAEINDAIVSHKKISTTINELYNKKVITLPFDIAELNLSDNCSGCSNVQRIAAQSKDKEKLLNQHTLELDTYDVIISAYKSKIQMQFEEFKLLGDYKKIYITNLLKTYQHNLIVQLENILLDNEWKLYDEYIENINQSAIFQSQFDTSVIANHNRRNELRAKASARRQILESNIDSFRQELSGLEREYGEITTSVKLMTEQLKQINLLQDELNVTIINFKLIDLYRTVLDERKGIPMLLLKRNITAFRNSVNQTLAQFTDMQLVIDDDLNIGVKIGAFHQDEPIEMGSGYQKFVISLAARVALIHVSNTPLLNGLIIDEGFSSLDFENRELAVDFLKELGSYHELLFIISHLEALQVAMDRPLIIERRIGAGEYSHIRNIVAGEKMVRPPDFVTDKDDPCKFFCIYCKKAYTSSALAKHKISKDHVNKIHEAGY
jgi:DNA repair exonuclease SbcCD nuclease subunit